MNECSRNLHISWLAHTTDIDWPILLILSTYNTIQCWHEAVRPTGHICYYLQPTSGSNFQVNLTKQVGSELQCRGTQLRSQTQQQLSWRHVTCRWRWQVYQNQTNVAGHSQYNLGSSCQYVEHVAPQFFRIRVAAVYDTSRVSSASTDRHKKKVKQVASFLDLYKDKQVASSLDLYKDTNK
jgi:hypothetical protein